jgi:hypothetical protein
LVGAEGAGVVDVVVGVEDLLVVVVGGVDAVLVPVLEVVVGVVVEVVPGLVVSETNSVVPALDGASDALVVDVVVVDELLSAELS